MQFKQFSVYLTTLIAGSTVVALPTQAATFALSEGIVAIEIEQTPSEIEVDTDTKTTAFSGSDSSIAIAEANADANFSSEPSSDISCAFGSLITPTDCDSSASQAGNLSSSLAQGAGDNYFGLAQSEAQVIGNFFLDANKAFSFDFLTSLYLETASDNLNSERARAWGEVSFELYDSSNEALIDSFSISGQLNTLGGNDFLTISPKSEFITFENTVETDFEGNEEFARAVVEGTYSRAFDSAMQIMLLETKNNKVKVQTTPESSGQFAILVFGLAGIVLTKKVSTIIRA